MNNLLNFFLKYSSWLLFTLLVAISCALLFTSNPYQHHVYLTSASRVASGVYETTSNISGYFSLRDINEDLQRRNADLEIEVLRLRQVVRDYKERLYADTMMVDSVLRRYSFIVASVINSSTTRTHNYITIEKGGRDGVKPEMGVIDQNGVVGIVNVTGEHTARIISLLNPHLRLSCKVRDVKGKDVVGSLQWNGKSASEAVLYELPRHARFVRGDTVVTSGFSTAFPEGVPVGTVVSTYRESDDNFIALRIKLLTDFNTLSTVRVVRDAMTDELRAIETDIEESTTME